MAKGDRASPRLASKAVQLSSSHPEALYHQEKANNMLPSKMQTWSTNMVVVAFSGARCQHLSLAPKNRLLKVAAPFGATSVSPTIRHWYSRGWRTHAIPHIHHHLATEKGYLGTRNASFDALLPRLLALVEYPHGSHWVLCFYFKPHLNGITGSFQGWLPLQRQRSCLGFSFCFIASQCSLYR